jgi:luciferase family oxidoreductase group 1
MTILSVLDLSPITEGSNARESLQRSRDLAQHCENWGYHRYWLAEHHNMRGIASAATAVAIGYIAEATSKIRVGAGGVMLPNHAPLIVAEQFGTLESLYPERIDLGLGRAPGTDQTTAHALRRNLHADVDQFPNDVVEILDYFRAPEGQTVQAIPGAGLDVPVWILGSSLFGAQLAAALGLPYAFASHFAPAQLEEAIKLYRERFRPSKYLDKPYVMAGVSVFAADSDEEGKLLASSMQQTFVSLRRGNPGPLQPPIKDYLENLAAPDRFMLDNAMSCAAIGNPDTVSQSLRELIARTQVDELIIASQIYDHEARLRSYEIVSEISPALE